MVLPPVKTCPIILFQISTDAPPDLVSFLKERLAEDGMQVVSEERSDKGGVILGLTTTQEELEAEAEDVRLVKPIVLGHGDDKEIVMDEFTVETRDSFLGYPSEEEADEYDSLGLFTSSDRAMLMCNKLDSITILEPGQMNSNLYRKLLEMKVIERRNLARSFARHLTNRSTEEHMDPGSTSLLLVLMQNGLVDIMSPVHVKHLRDKIMRETLALNAFSMGGLSHMDTMRNYYGEEIAFYFAWLQQYTRWLIFPGLMGLFVSIYRRCKGQTVDNCSLIPFHGLAVFLWAVLFLQYWEREEKRLSYHWGTFSTTGYEKRFFDRRPAFYGELRVSPVTGSLEKYYPSHKRRMKYVISALVTAVLLSGAFVVMIISLNMQGYVRPHDDRDRWQEDNDHPFYYPFFAQLAEEGNVFDAKSSWRCFIPVLLHVCAVMTMNMHYRKVAEWLTEWENHETWITHENSLILKRFLFEAFDAYIILFYLAFYERDMRKLKGELVGLFNIDTFRRLLLECAVPYLLHRISSTKKRDADAQRKKTDNNGIDENEYAPLGEEAELDPYEEFDDYLEMIIQMGYVTLFASAYPFAAFIAIFANLVEIRTDILKISKVCMRARPTRTTSIGMWKQLMTAMIWLSALTNCLIFGFSSKQLMQYMPDYYYIDDYGQHRLSPSKEKYVVLLIVGIERVLILVALFIGRIVPDTPGDVKEKVARGQFLQMEAARKSRARRRASSLREFKRSLNGQGPKSNTSGHT
mmetsp:Transcript_30118/g.61431  ORF Transcript_30118/g.61431 Transcript_30118/m.61431 type:complete len:747 (-) Transcript_30118:50-2290(-)|eukprot:CAMPEP_0183311990 /NCGR_PEP_ID=MMETSP0160_2-20130417/39779_1 /TAXON_ID=2839 ORGANISM="Odontella Sinensis, Strain Grunow 1884" /NCGR_SAMPLE_ID=MMETSP0160_2 /ASSEMBLY_ACC=CAM_ASM_000250 /LENGTH=746 /DNA_ID=CAMNT_0025476751 /DNA_START=161 /DNA_END=2401 /DNA_ORIENTATION=+